MIPVVFISACLAESLFSFSCALPNITIIDGLNATPPPPAILSRSARSRTPIDTSSSRRRLSTRPRASPRSRAVVPTSGARLCARTPWTRTLGRGARRGRRRRPRRASRSIERVAFDVERASRADGAPRRASVERCACARGCEDCRALGGTGRDGTGRKGEDEDEDGRCDGSSEEWCVR